MTEKITRASIPALDDILGQQFPVLDHGHVRLIDYMGDDAAIVQAARVSYGKGTKSASDDKALINYLLRNKHTSPFEMCEIKLHCKMPIFVARQWVRHRTASLNEYSGRYSVMADETYVPASENIAVQSTDNKQGREDTPLSDDEAADIQKLIRDSGKASFGDYHNLLNEDGVIYDDTGKVMPQVARELSRMVLPLNTYTEWYWKIDLHNLLHFLRLRLHPHSQYETRVYAEEIANIVQKWVPMTWAAFEEHGLNSVQLSATAWSVMRDVMGNNDLTKMDLPDILEKRGVSKREIDEINNLFK